MMSQNFHLDSFESNTVLLVIQSIADSAYAPGIWVQNLCRSLMIEPNVATEAGIYQHLTAVIYETYILVGKTVWSYNRFKLVE